MWKNYPAKNKLTLKVLSCHMERAYHFFPNSLSRKKQPSVLKKNYYNETGFFFRENDSN